MSLHRFFLTAPLKPDGESAVLPAAEPFALPLSPDDVHHIVDVLRLKAGAEIIVVEPGRSAWVAVLFEVGPESVTALPIRALAAPVEPRVTLIQGLAKGDKLDLVVEKAVEIGVEAVVPIAFERSVVKLDAGRAHARGERLRRVAAAAAKQAQRTFVPAVTDPGPATIVLDVLSDYDVVLVAWEDAQDAPGIGEALRSTGADISSRVAIVVGPEGGLTEREVAALVGAGAVTVSLGDTVLRTETAGILSAALCVYEMGGLGGRLRG